MPKPMPTFSLRYPPRPQAAQTNALGMRPMQERAFEKRGERYLLIKSPPASGKSRALMFIALDKLHNQGLKQAIVVVPERAIGASFHDERLSEHGFEHDWTVVPRWNLCDAPGTEDGGKVESVKAFLESEDRILICTHATFRFALKAWGVEAFDDRVIAVDEFHHVSANPDNQLGSYLTELIARDRVHIVAMTGSYFRGDADAILSLEDEARFVAVTYTYYEQLRSYEYLKNLDIGYFFYAGSYIDDLPKVLNPAEKTILHIPNVNSRESTKDKRREVEHILSLLGEWVATDETTGFQLVKQADGRILRIADLVEDEPSRRDRVSMALKDPAHKYDRDHVDIIIALGMAKEGFDWVWCEHALTVGYRSSLTEIVQIIGRATRDAPGKTRARFTNLIAEPDASEQAVAEATNDTLKAIAAGLLMEQVLAPRFEFRPKKLDAGPDPSLDYGEKGYDAEVCNIGVHEPSGTYVVEVRGLIEPQSPEAKRVCEQDIPDLIAAAHQNKPLTECAVFDADKPPQVTTQVRIGAIVRERYPNLSPSDQEAIRQIVVAQMALASKYGKLAAVPATTAVSEPQERDEPGDTRLLDDARRYSFDVRDLNIELIDAINPFGEAYAILAKSMSEESLRQIADAIMAKRTTLTPEEARDMALRAAAFVKDRGRPPNPNSPDVWERQLAEAAAAFMRYRKEGRYESP